MSKAHPGFNKVASNIEAAEGVSKKSADAILAASSRNASKSAKKKKNPRLNKVSGSNPFKSALAKSAK